MRKKIGILCLSVLVIALSVNASLGAGALTSPVSIAWGTASLGGTAQVVATAVASVITRHEPNLRISVQATGGSLENVRLLRAEEVEMAHTTEGFSAVNGIGPFEGEPPTEMWALFSMYSNEFVLAVLEDSGIYTIEDLVGKTVSGGPPGSGVNQQTLFIWEAYGITDQVNHVNLSYPAGIDALMDETIHAMSNFTSASLLNPSMAQLEQTVNYRVLQVDSDKINMICERNPDFAPMYITGGSLRALPENFLTFASFSIQYADSRMSDEIAYVIVRTLYENNGDLVAYHSIGATMSAYNALVGIPRGVMVHPGAARYFKERGVWRDDLVVATR
jgi:TRAP transporter TAXI family solute receptor